MPHPRDPSRSRHDKTLMRSLGEFVGHIWSGVKADPSKERRVLRQEVEEEEREGAGGEKIILRRTTTEEIEIRRD